MRRPIDSLFGRLALLVVAVLLLSHFAWYALMRVERSPTANALRGRGSHLPRRRGAPARRPNSPDQPLPSRVKLVDPASPEVPPGRRGHCRRRSNASSKTCATACRPARRCASASRAAAHAMGARAPPTAAGSSCRCSRCARRARSTARCCGLPSFSRSRSWRRCSPRGRCSSRCARSPRRSRASAAACRCRRCRSAGRASCVN